MVTSNCEEGRTQLSGQKIDPRKLRKWKMYVLSIDTVVGILTFLIAVLFFGHQISNEAVIHITKMGCVVSLSMLAITCTILLKMFARDNEQFVEWLNKEFDFTFKDFLGAFEMTAGAIGLSFLVSIILMVWSIVNAYSDSGGIAISTLLVSFYLGFLLYSVVAFIQRVVACVGYFKRRRVFQNTIDN